MSLSRQAKGLDTSNRGDDELVSRAEQCLGRFQWERTGRSLHLEAPQAPCALGAAAHLQGALRTHHSSWGTLLHGPGQPLCRASCRGQHGAAEAQQPIWDPGGLGFRVCSGHRCRSAKCVSRTSPKRPRPRQLGGWARQGGAGGLVWLEGELGPQAALEGAHPACVMLLGPSYCSSRPRHVLPTQPTRWLLLHSRSHRSRRPWSLPGYRDTL